jgi:hypothetical protein
MTKSPHEVHELLTSALHSPAATGEGHLSIDCTHQSRLIPLYS